MYMPNELLDVLRGGYVSMVGKKAWLKPAKHKLGAEQ